MIYRLYCLINQETYGMGVIQRDSMGRYYDVNMCSIALSNISKIKIKRFINELSNRFGGNLKKSFGGGFYVIENKDIPNISIAVYSDQYKIDFSVF